MSDTMITLQDFYKKFATLTSEDAVLDVRGPDEYLEAHIENAINIPVDQVDQDAGKLKKYKNVYIHCKRGGRAKRAFEILKLAGLNNIVCVHDAGMDMWIEKGYPVKRG